MPCQVYTWSLDSDCNKLILASGVSGISIGERMELFINLSSDCKLAKNINNKIR